MRFVHRTRLEDRIEAARLYIDKAVRCLSRNDPNSSSDALGAAMNFAAEAWCVKNDIAPDFGNGWHSLERQVRSLDPPWYAEWSRLAASLTFIDCAVESPDLEHSMQFCREAKAFISEMLGQIT